ncbi:unnamed protein product [Symbiodinium pilosum]|uniref:Uncharacterized protein n=1 Tax=Symbiodinium pilosum TaxID=2952 RepID=A0A812UFB6_SYMPI|nr:unnamed protein product [Symbiodinium pilosum]
MQEERARSSRLAAELRNAQVIVQKLQGQLDLHRERDELLGDLDGSLGQEQARKGGRKQSLQAQEKQEKKAVMAELAQIEKMRSERQKDRQQRLKQAKGKGKGKRSADEAGLPTKEQDIVDLD